MTNPAIEERVLMCECKPFGPVHAWEPGEWCPPDRVIPKAENSRISQLEQEEGK